MDKKIFILLCIAACLTGCSKTKDSDKLSNLISDYQHFISDMGKDGYVLTEHEKCQIIETYHLLTLVRDFDYDKKLEIYIIENAKCCMAKISLGAQRRKKVYDEWQNNKPKIYLDKKTYDVKLKEAIEDDILWCQGIFVSSCEYDTKELPYFFDCSPRGYVVKNGVVVPCSYEEAFKAKHVIDIQMTNIQSDH